MSTIGADYNGFNQSITLNPTLPVRDPADPRLYNYINTGFVGANNPVEGAMVANGGEDIKYLDMSGAFKLNISKNLYTQLMVAQQTTDKNGYGFTPSYSLGAIHGNAGRNSASQSNNRNTQQTLEWVANYDLDIKQHSIKLLGGYSYNYFIGSGFNASNSNFPSDILTYNNLGTGTYNLPIPNGSSGDFTFRGVGSYKGDSKLIAFFGRLNYSLGDKYYMSASVRREGSSKFGYDYKWGYFPAASVGWRISNEAFFPKINWLSDMKLRADYGVTGNQDFDSYKSLDTYSGFGYYAYNGTSYQVWGPSQNTNYNLRWEKAKNFNAGIDFELFQNKVSGSVNYYVRTNQDLLGSYDVPVPPNLQSSTFVNVGTMTNSGFEIQLNGTVIKKNHFTYDVTFAGATNQNQFVSFSNDVFRGQDFNDMVGMPAPGSPGTAQRLQEGRRIGSFYMLRAAGVDATGKLMVYNKNGEVIPGNTANADDKQFVGNGLPKFTASMGHTFTYRGLDLSIFLRGAFGYDVFNTTSFYLGTPSTQIGANVLKSTFEGGKYAILTNPETYSTLSNYFLEKGDFVKIDNVSLGYNFKSPVKQLSSGRLYFTARNLYTFTRWTTGDIESVNVNGLTPGINASLNYYPSATQLLVGLQLKF